MPNAQPYHLTVYSEFSYLETVADFIGKIAAANHLDERSAYKVQMAVDEAVTNIIEHAYQGRKDGRIDISVERNGGNLVIEIRDSGHPFDVTRIAKPRVKGPLSRRSVGGLGVFFMNKLMDKVEFSTTPAQGNLVRMVKKIR